MNYYYLLFFVVCFLLGMAMVTYGDSRKKNATRLSDFTWYSGLILIIFSFSLLVFPVVKSDSDKVAIKTFWFLLFTFWVIFSWMISLESYPKK